MVRRNNIPWRRPCCGRIDRIRKGILIGIPVLSLLVVAAVELPVLLRFLDAGKETLCLFLLGHIQEELHRAYTVVIQIGLKVDDVLATVFDHMVIVDAVRMGLRFIQLLHFADQHIFILGTVEDGDFALGRHFLFNAPEKVMGKFRGGR